MIQTIGYPRAALIGNPSDGFHGRTIAFTFSNFSAQVALTSSAGICLGKPGTAGFRFDDMHALKSHIDINGYDPDIALVQAAVKRFDDYCRRDGLATAQTGFEIRFRSDIPYQVGIAGSSAIIVAVFRALLQFNRIRIPYPQLANLVLSVETDELGIPAGLQDRVAQVYQGLVHMDFSKKYFDQHGCGRYAYLDPALLPDCYIAWRQSGAEGSGIFHSNIRQRYAAGDKDVIAAIETWIRLTDDLRQALEQGNNEAVHEQINANFDCRARMYAISKENLQMITMARECGASAKFTGSGGAAIGTYEDETMFRNLQKRFSENGISIIKPVIALPLKDDDH